MANIEQYTGLMAANSLRTNRGLAIWVLCITFIYVSFLALMSSIYKVSIRHSVIVEIVIISSLFIVWAFKSKRIIFPTEKYRIIFAIPFKKESQRIRRELIDELKRRLSKISNNSDYQLIVFPEDRGFKNAKQANKFVGRKKVNLMIWGSTLESEKTKVNFELTYNFDFITSVKNNIAKVAQQIGPAISEGVPLGSWEIPYNFQADQIELVAENIIEVATFIIARSLALRGDMRSIEAALVQVLEIKRRQSSFFLNNKNFHKHVIGTIGLYHNVLAWHKYARRDFQSTEGHIEGFLSLSPTNIRAILDLARIKVELGKIEEAKGLVHRAKKVNPRDPVVLVDEAYFALVDGNYERAVRKYHEIGAINTNYIDLVDFYDKQFKKTNNPAMLFGAGYISSVFLKGENKFGYFEEFIEQHSNDQKYSVLVVEARRIINRG